MDNIIKTSILLSLVFFFVGCGSASKKDVEIKEQERIEKVSTISLSKTTINRQIELSTVLEGYEVVNIAPSLSGRIEHIYVEVGTNVSAGDLLVRMDQNQLKTTRLTFTNLGVELERLRVLRETETVSQQAYDQVKLSYDQTKESLDFLEANTFVKAPISGVISEKNYEDGELFGGTPILQLTQIHKLKALINVPESYFPVVKKGMNVLLRSEIYPNQTFPAVIEMVYPTIDQNTHTFQAKLVVNNSKNELRPGMFVRTTLALDEIEAIVVPYQAVQKLTGSNVRFVFINNDGKAKRVEVSLGQRFDETIEITSGEIKEGDELVVLGQAKLVDGVKLDVVK